jgi:predicted DNA-binding protein (MmcQ/YjbR family)
MLMVDIKTFKKLALSFPDTVQEPHFEKASFRVKKKIFATLSEEKSMALVKLSEIDQSVFCSFDKSIIFPVDNKWGKKGWTVIDLKKVRKDLLQDALTTAYNEVAKTKKIKNGKG